VVVEAAEHWNCCDRLGVMGGIAVSLARGLRSVFSSAGRQSASHVMIEVRKAACSQASEIKFELHTLGWKVFQDLCLAVSEEILKRPVG
jgi:hypothetical protein